jgi:hypothetical protein
MKEKDRDGEKLIKKGRESKEEVRKENRNEEGMNK